MSPCFCSVLNLRGSVLKYDKKIKSKTRGAAECITEEMKDIR